MAKKKRKAKPDIGQALISSLIASGSPPPKPVAPALAAMMGPKWGEWDTNGGPRGGIPAGQSVQDGGWRPDEVEPFPHPGTLPDWDPGSIEAPLPNVNMVDQVLAAMMTGGGKEFGDYKFPPTNGQAGEARSRWGGFHDPEEPPGDLRNWNLQNPPSEWAPWGVGEAPSVNMAADNMNFVGQVLAAMLGGEDFLDQLDGRPAWTPESESNPPRIDLADPLGEGNRPPMPDWVPKWPARENMPEPSTFAGYEPPTSLTSQYTGRPQLPRASSSLIMPTLNRTVTGGAAGAGALALLLSQLFLGGAPSPSLAKGKKRKGTSS